MEYQSMGESNLKISAVAMGCWGLVGGPMWGDQEEAESIRTLDAAMDAGITLFDTAEGYGNGYSEEILGKAFAGKRHQVVIATKASSVHFSAADLRKACENSLHRLKTDYIDLYQLHWPNRDGIAISETAGTLEKLKTEGKIREYGVCNFGVQDLKELMPHLMPLTDQLPYGPLWRAVEFEIQPLTTDKGIGILTYSTLMHGLLSGKYSSPDEFPEGRARTRHFSKDRPDVRHGEEGYEEATFTAVRAIRDLCTAEGVSMSRAAIAWTARRPGVTSVIAGATKPGQIVENAAAINEPLPAALEEGITTATGKLKEAMGPNPDMWQTPGRIR